MRTADELLAKMAREQHQVVTAADARGCGLSDSDVSRRCSTGRLVRLYDEVYTFANSAPSFPRDVYAAVAAGGATAFASGATAAKLWRLPGGKEDPVEITCARWRRAHRSGIIVRERIRVLPSDLRVVDGIRVSRPELNLVEVVRVCGVRVGEMYFHEARRRKLVTYESTRDVFLRHARRGMAGIAGTRRILDRYESSGVPAESPREVAMMQAIRAAGLPQPELQLEILDRHRRVVARADAGYRELRIAVDYHSDDWHSTPEQIEADEARRNAMWAAGWVPIVARRNDLNRGGPQFIAALRSAIQLRHDADLGSYLRR